MRRDAGLRREVAIAGLAAKVLAIVLPLLQIVTGLRADFTGPARRGAVTFLYFLASPLMLGAGLYLLALIDLALARIEARGGLGSGRRAPEGGGHRDRGE